jgi:hypothetical protein
MRPSPRLPCLKEDLRTVWGHSRGRWMRGAVQWLEGRGGRRGAAVWGRAGGRRGAGAILQWTRASATLSRDCPHSGRLREIDAPGPAEIPRLPA